MVKINAKRIILSLNRCQKEYEYFLYCFEKTKDSIQKVVNIADILLYDCHDCSITDNIRKMINDNLFYLDKINEHISHIDYIIDNIDLSDEGLYLDVHINDYD